ncbi:hypothetical protein CFP65_6753 [Kitasatospora sp. MMS16-BH015]|uniref:hypothetical protein n=1 Tax=Kitasatospora sp. MMS16-BH015 TaxID=2018025 RepID=UPI000CA2C46A|nr:hypothetical protein [Kitasatospora sp. MMS16-BH015]AUG81393.1 hypothetical protein CFP65_6753 [Kitasatospora sp. MMS16-BH015]
MRRNAAPSTTARRARRAGLALLGAALATSTTLLGAPAATAAPAAVSASMGCDSEPDAFLANNGTIDCNLSVAGSSSYSVSWSTNGRTIWASGNSTRVGCSYGQNIVITATVVDRTTGARAGDTSYPACVTSGVIQ